MNLTRDRVQSIGWAFILVVCAALTAALMLRVNAVKGQVNETERRIVNVRGQISFLETEFMTRANQQQLKAINDVEFGYVAPRAEQYIEGERQLASLGKPRAPGAPSPIRMAVAVPADDRPAFLKMVSPITGLAAAASEVVETKTPVARAEPTRSGAAKADAGDHGDDAVGAAIAASQLGRHLSDIKLTRVGDE